MLLVYKDGELVETVRGRAAAGGVIAWSLAFTDTSVGIWRIDAVLQDTQTGVQVYRNGPNQVVETFTPPDIAPACVNINTAPFEDLRLIHQIDVERANEIIRLRQEQPFSSVEDLTRVSGIGDVLVQQIIAQGLACV